MICIGFVSERRQLGHGVKPLEILVVQILATTAHFSPAAKSVADKHGLEHFDYIIGEFVAYYHECPPASRNWQPADRC